MTMRPTMLVASFLASLLIMKPVVEAALAPDPELVAPEAALEPDAPLFAPALLEPAPVIEVILGLELLPEADPLEDMPVPGTAGMADAAVEPATGIDTIQGADVGQLTVTIVAAVTVKVWPTVAKTVGLGQ